MFRNSFEGVSVASSFWMKEVTVPRVPSLAFNFDHIKEFSIYGSRFDRVSMWGFKLARNANELSFCHSSTMQLPFLFPMSNNNALTAITPSHKLKSKYKSSFVAAAAASSMRSA